jgi:imidazolonepropionase-like amidohydrolase
MAGGGAMSPSDEIDTSQYSIEELKAAVEEAQAVGTYVMGHVYSSRSILNCTAAGVRTLEHGNLLDEKAARSIEATGAFLVPTLVTYEVTPRLGKDLGIPEKNIRKMIEARERGLDALAIAHRVGVKIASGSDLLGPMQIYKGMELELKSRVLGPMGAIVATTKTNAELLKKEKDLGTIEAGKLADLILINGDPLKDMKLFQQYQEKITLIIQGGRVHKDIL